MAQLPAALQERISELSTQQVDSPTQVIQLIRQIGAATSSETQSVESVNVELTEAVKDGWTIRHVEVVGVIPGGVMVYFLLMK